MRLLDQSNRRHISENFYYVFAVEIKLIKANKLKWYFHCLHNGQKLRITPPTNGIFHNLFQHQKVSISSCWLQKDFNY